MDGRAQANGQKDDRAPLTRLCQVEALEWLVQLDDEGGKPNEAAKREARQKAENKPLKPGPGLGIMVDGRCYHADPRLDPSTVRAVS
jgi:hypothetical protein